MRLDARPPTALGSNVSRQWTFQIRDEVSHRLAAGTAGPGCLAGPTSANTRFTGGSERTGPGVGLRRWLAFQMRLRSQQVPAGSLDAPTHACITASFARSDHLTRASHDHRTRYHPQRMLQYRCRAIAQATAINGPLRCRVSPRPSFPTSPALLRTLLAQGSSGHPAYR